MTNQDTVKKGTDILKKELPKITAIWENKTMT
jgi:hypothetical protein